MICKDNFLDEKSYRIYECLRKLNETKDLYYLLNAFDETEIVPDLVYKQAIEMNEFANSNCGGSLYYMASEEMLNHTWNWKD